MNLKSDAKIRGFGADSKLSEGILLELLRHVKGFATVWGNGGGLCRKGHKKRLN